MEENNKEISGVAGQEQSTRGGEERMVLRTENLVKKYGKRTVANHVSINVTQGEIVGLLGPNGSGKTVRVAVFAEGAAAQAAEEAGADIVGTDILMEQIQAGEFNFDAAVATPDQMGKVGRLGKILGPRGLMPNPKLGTVTNDVAKAINELKGGRVEYRADRYGIAHVILGKVSLGSEQLAENYGAVYDEILRMKPAAAKGKYVKSITVSATMTPGVAVDSAVTRAYTAE